MGEWSDYFEDFPEENPANDGRGKLDPALAEMLRAQEERALKAKAEIHKLRVNAWLKEKEKYYLLTEACPQCGLEELKTYYVRNEYYLCECQDCGIYGKGDTHDEALKATFDALGEGLDWKENREPWAR